MTTTKILAAACALCAISIAACGQKSDNHEAVKTSDEITDFEIRQTVKTLQRDYLCEGAEAYYDDSIDVYTSVKIAIEWPEKMGDNDIKVLQDSLLAASFDSVVPGDIDRTMILSAERPEGIDMFKLKVVDSIPSTSLVRVYLRNLIVSAITFSPEFIVYQIMTETYEGGAHGMYESHYINYSFANAKVISSSDAFIAGKKETLLQAVKDCLMTQCNVSSMKGLEELGFFTDQIYVTNNFFIRGYNIIFHYNPYAIAPYSHGSIDVVVPYYQIEDCLTPEIKQLIIKGANF